MTSSPVDNRGKLSFAASLIYTIKHIAYNLTLYGNTNQKLSRGCSGNFDLFPDISRKDRLFVPFPFPQTQNVNGNKSRLLVDIVYLFFRWKANISLNFTRLFQTINEFHNATELSVSEIYMESAARNQAGYGGFFDNNEI